MEKMNIYLLSAVLFVLYIVIDFAWAMYISTIAHKHYFKASVWSAIIMGLGAFGVISYIENKWLLIPAILGGAVGTYLTKYMKNGK